VENAPWIIAAIAGRSAVFHHPRLPRAPQCFSEWEDGVDPALLSVGMDPTGDVPVDENLWPKSGLTLPHAPMCQLPETPETSLQTNLRKKERDRLPYLVSSPSAGDE
jgi:hypothetical protein